MVHTSRRRAGAWLTSALLALGALGLGASSAQSATAATSAADDGTFVGVFRETRPLTAIADGYRADTGLELASALWFEAWSNKRAFPVQEAKPQL